MQNGNRLKSFKKTYSVWSKIYTYAYTFICLYKKWIELFWNPENELLWNSKYEIESKDMWANKAVPHVKVFSNTFSNACETEKKSSIEILLKENKPSFWRFSASNHALARVRSRVKLFPFIFSLKLGIFCPFSVCF